MVSFAVIALLLAATGIYSISSFFVAQRTHEIGVKDGIGREGRRYSDHGAETFTADGGRRQAIGLPLALAMTMLMSSALYGVVSVNWLNLPP